MLHCRCSIHEVPEEVLFSALVFVSPLKVFCCGCGMDFSAINHIMFKGYSFKMAV